MTLLADLEGLLARLAPLGWQSLLAAHGIDLAAADLEAELLRELPTIDRELDGFEDFTLRGRRGIQPGDAAGSLLFHALASPRVLTTPSGEALGGFPTLGELDLVENVIFGLRPPSLAELRARFPGRPMAVCVYATEYRPAVATVGRRHADLCFARAGVARVGNADAEYLPPLRGFLPFVEGEPRSLRVMPSRYSPYLAVQLDGDTTGFGPMNPDQRIKLGGDPSTRDRDRRFWVPLHKLFPGDECVRDHDLTIEWEVVHRNEKIRRVHLQLAAQGYDTGWSGAALDDAPFAFATGIAELSTHTDDGLGLLVPEVHARMVEAAERGGKPLTFRVPAKLDNQWAPSYLIDGEDDGSRLAPEYVHVRHVIDDDGEEHNLNDLADVTDRVRQGGFRARHYTDFTGDGWVIARSPQLAVEVPRAIPAYSMVTAPDFFPACDQRELVEWWIERVPTALRNRIWGQAQPLTLADERLPPNLALTAVGADFRAEDDTATSLVALPMSPVGVAGPVPSWTDRRSSHLPDTAAGIFAPGWDTSVGRTDGVLHLAAYGLGSPFPEDAKLCAAISSYWPAVAPDAGRSFSVEFPTSTPMTDREIGIVGDLPWDGVPGPRPVSGQPGMWQYAEFAHVDYVESALEQAFSLWLTGQVSIVEYQARILAASRSYLALGVDRQDPRWRVLSFLEVAPNDPERTQAQAATGVTLADPVFRVVGGRGGPNVAGPDPRVVHVSVPTTSTALIGTTGRVLVRAGGGGWTAVTVA